MKPFHPRAVELAAPKQQRNWDWRAAAFSAFFAATAASYSLATTPPRSLTQSTMLGANHMMVRGSKNRKSPMPRSQRIDNQRMG